MSPLLIGGLGGLCPIVAVLIVGNGEPLAGYIRNLTLGSVEQVFIGYTIKAALLFVIGLIWVKLNNETDKIKAFQLGIAAPAIITGMVATSKVDRESNSEPVLGYNLIISKAYAAEGSESDSSSSAVDNILKGFLSYSSVESLGTSDLVKLFNGPDRRKASDRLISLYENNKKSVVDSVIGAIVPDGPSGYRINIYVARTLSGIPGGWEGTEEQKQQLISLRGQSSYKADQTFRANLEKAIINWKKS